MGSAALIAKLNPGSNFPRHFSGNSYQKITPQDIAGAIGIAKLPPGPDYLIRIKFALQEKYRPELHFSLAVYAAQKARSDAIKIGSLSEIAIDDFLRSHTCPYCKGTGIRCQPCGSSGIRSGNRQQLLKKWAAQNSISWRTYQRRWHDKFLDLLDILGRWERVGLAAIKLIG